MLNRSTDACDDLSTGKVFSKFINRKINRTAVNLLPSETLSEKWQPVSDAADAKS